MNFGDELPDDLVEIERALARRARPAPPAELRRRMLASVEREAARGRELWFVAAAAAVIVAVALRPPMANTSSSASREVLAWARAELRAQPERSASAEPLDLARAAERASRLAELAQIPLLAPAVDPGG